MSSETGPAIGHTVVRDNVFYEITDIQETLDGPLVEAKSPEAVPSRILVKASDLTASGSPVPGLTLWK